jgi:hypothetical protein
MLMRGLVLRIFQQQKHYYKKKAGLNGRPSFSFVLELEPHRDLHLPHVGCSAGVGAKARGCRISSQNILETGEVRVIEHVEHFPAELEVSALRDCETLSDSRVEVGKTVKAQVIASAGPLITNQRLREVG